MGLVRFLLALCVVVTHYPGNNLFGIQPLSAITAVQAFYVISGFLITMVLNERTEYADLGKFYLSRYLRLWPTYIVIVVAQLLLNQNPALFARLTVDPLATAYLVFTNLTIFGQDLALFLRFGDQGQLIPTAAFNEYPRPQVVEFLLVPQAWTLGIELAFYLIAPFFCRRLSRLLALFVAATTVRIIIGIYQPASDVWIYRFFPAELMLFAAGGLAYFAGRGLRDLSAQPVFRLMAGTVLVGTMLAIIFGVVTTGLPFRPYVLPSLWLKDPAFLLLMAASCPVLFYFTNRNTWDNFIGELSYPMYVSHILTSQTIVLQLGYYPANWIYVLTVIGVSVALFFLVALPIDHFRARLGARLPVTPIPREINPPSRLPAIQP